MKRTKKNPTITEAMRLGLDANRILAKTASTRKRDAGWYGPDYVAHDGKTYTGSLAEQKAFADKVTEWLQTMPTDVLAAAARGEVNLNRVAREELAARGLNDRGKWVGFEEAKRLSKYSRVDRGDGTTVLISIPDRDDDN